MKARWLLCILCVSLKSYAGEEIKGIVGKVLDGNTIEVTADDHETYKVLLHGIDSPEPRQEYAEQAKKLLSTLLLNKRVAIQIQGKDRLGTRLGEISVDGAGDPRHELIKEGLAWTSEKAPIAELESLKEKARLEGKGLWKDENPTPPWIFRRQQSMLQPKSS